MEVTPQIAFENGFPIDPDARQAILQVGVIHRRFTPARQVGTGRNRLPFDLAQPVVQPGKEMSALLMRHELAEELLIAPGGAGIAQLARQFSHEFERRRVLFEWVLRVMGNIRDQGNGAGRGVCIRDDQDDAGQLDVHHRQVVAVDGATVPAQVLAVIEQALHHIKGVLLDVVFHQCHVRRDVERSLVAEGDSVAQDVAGHAVVRQQEFVQVLLILRTNVQFTAQRFELLDAQFVLELDHVEMPTGVGAGDELGVLGERLVTGKIVQGGIQQRDGAAGGPGRKVMHPP
ncbi:hypothetical protein D3C71_1294130 [compost metagenome]